MQAQPKELVKAPKAQGEALAAELLRRGADPDDADGRGDTALFLAAARGQQGIVASMLTAGADAVRADRSVGQTASMAAARCGHAGVCSQLLAGGAVNAKLPDGKTALTWSKKWGAGNCNQVLQAAGGCE